MRRLIAVLFSFFPTFSGPFFATPDLAVEGEAQDKHLTGGKFWLSVGTTVLIDTVAGAVGGALSKGIGKIVEEPLEASVKPFIAKTLQIATEAISAYLPAKAISLRARIFRDRLGL